ncbi:hypothetical protein [Aeromonas caviae]|uniref:hypothetical protein n=1 Tax=Aeromonas caviae TaxID=648 RepID=UPI002B490229|nr:hypothetical protein [Aeromonas caviae]
MGNYFKFRFQQASEHRESLVIFFHPNIDVSSLTKSIREDVDEKLVPQRVYLMGYNLDSTLINTLTSDRFFVDEFESWIGTLEEKLSYLTISSTGQIKCPHSDKDIDFAPKLLNAGAKYIFESRKGLITSLPSYHFLKPSGDHCDKFIRASNLFTSGLEVAFLAIGLLPFLKKNIKRVYVDTSSISFLVSIAIQLSKRFDEQLPVIESFESYSIFNKPYEFQEDGDSLVIISATTSGGLAQKLTQKHTFDPSNVITLFYSQVKSGQYAIYNISESVGKITSVKSNSCELCRDGSKLIKIEGEQFIPETPKHELLVIKKTDFKENRQKFFKEFATQGILKFNTSPSENWEREHFFIDVKKLLELHVDDFKKVLLKTVNKHFSRDIKTIISLDDEHAIYLAKEILTIVDDPSINIVSYQEAKEEDLKGHGSVMVVASAITSGRQLLATARKLRGIASTSTITYLIGFSKLPTRESFEQLRKDLCLGGHEVLPLKTCYLPRFNGQLLSPWDIEKNKLSSFESIDDPFNLSDAKLPPLLSGRLSKINANPSQNELFLPSPQGAALHLRNTFAFWDELKLDTNKASQADVYWTIQSILHDLRIENDKGLATTYHSTLLSPVCFDRFNDGVIQACLLRAAKPAELNYSIDFSFSRQMTDIIISVIKNHENPQGEGCLEFLLALWCGRLKVQCKHLEEILSLRDTANSEDVKFILFQLFEQQKDLMGSHISSPPST